MTTAGTGYLVAKMAVMPAREARRSGRGGGQGEGGRRVVVIVVAMLVAVMVVVVIVVVVAATVVVLVIERARRRTGVGHDLGHDLLDGPGAAAALAAAAETAIDLAGGEGFLGRPHRGPDVVVGQDIARTHNHENQQFPGWTALKRLGHRR